jgi:hypothetical protein
MKLSCHRRIFAVLPFLVLAGACGARADGTLVSFSNFKSDALYEAWAANAKPAPVIQSTATNYAITATGYGVNWKYIGGKSSAAAGCTAIELDVTLAGPAAADGQLGPIVDLIDSDGTRNSYRWYGQTLGHHVLTLPLDAPTEVVKPGTAAGLNLAALQHLHLSVDPGQFGKAAPYTITFNSLRLTGSETAQAKP